MRKQQTKLKTGRKRFWLIILIYLLLGIAGILVGYQYFTFSNSYKPPAFEQNAVPGVPTPPENMAYSPVNAEGGFAFALAGNLYQQENGELCIYLTNPTDSGVWLMCEIESPHYGVVYKSGVIKQGEYVERLAPLMEFPNEASKIELRVYGFNPDDWQSKGTVYLNTTLQPW